MKKVFLSVLMVLAAPVFANDYQDGRRFAEKARRQAMTGLHNLQGREGNLSQDFTRTPAESALDHNTLQEEGLRAAASTEVGQEIRNQRTLEKPPVDLASPEMIGAGKTIEEAEERIKAANIPCKDGDCLPTEDEYGNDFGEGASRLGIVAGAAKEVSGKQIKKGIPAIFAGTNATCRMVVAGIGNCCGKAARLLSCRAEEKALLSAIKDKRARFVGTYCAHRTLGICLEEKQSWCVFPTLLASIMQIQGREGQLGIDFGRIGHDANHADCRGLTPAELARIDFERINLGPLAKEFESRYVPKNVEKIEAVAASKIRQMEKEGRARG